MTDQLHYKMEQSRMSAFWEQKKDQNTQKVFEKNRVLMGTTCFGG